MPMRGDPAIRIVSFSVPLTSMKPSPSNQNGDLESADLKTALGNTLPSRWRHQVSRAQERTLKWRPPAATLPAIGPQVDGDILVRLLHVVREARMVQVEYQSVSRPHPTRRILSPHAFAHDGFH